MVLGIYYLTYGPPEEELAKLDEALTSGKKAATNGSRPKTFRSAQEAELVYENGGCGLHDHAEYRRAGHEHFLTTVGRIIFNERIERALAEALGDNFDPERYEVPNRALKKRDGDEGRDRVDLVEPMGPRRSHRSSMRSRTSDSTTRPRPGSRSRRTSSAFRQGRVLERYEKQTAEIQSQYDDDYITAEERHEAVTAHWNKRPTRSRCRWRTTSTSSTRFS